MSFRLFAAIAATSLSLFTLACSAKDASEYVEGKHYKVVREVAEPSDNKRIAVEEFFWPRSSPGPNGCRPMSISCGSRTALDARSGCCTARPTTPPKPSS